MCSHMPLRTIPASHWNGNCDRWTSRSDAGNPLEWEMHQLTAAEGAELARGNVSNIRMLTTMVAHSLVKPDLRNAEFLRVLSQ